MMLAIFVSVTSNANGSLSSNIRDDINVMMSVTLPMPVRLLLFLCSIEVRIVVTLVTSVASGTRVTLVRLVSWR